VRVHQSVDILIEIAGPLHNFDSRRAYQSAAYHTCQRGMGPVVSNDFSGKWSHFLENLIKNYQSAPDKQFLPDSAKVSPLQSLEYNLTHYCPNV